MPFTSVAQMSTCFKKRPKGWNCEESLAKTNICALHNRSEGDVSKNEVMRKPGQPPPKMGPIKTGPRGGRYREVWQGTCMKKLYL